MERPDEMLCLPGRHVIKLSRQSMLMEFGTSSPTYARLSTADVMAVTWQTFTEDQIVEMAKAVELEESAPAGR